MSENSPGSNDVVGVLSSIIFKRDLLDEKSSPFVLLTTYIDRRGLNPGLNTWNNPSNLYNVNYNLVNPGKKNLVPILLVEVTAGSMPIVGPWLLELPWQPNLLLRLPEEGLFSPVLTSCLVMYCFVMNNESCRTKFLLTLTVHTQTPFRPSEEKFGIKTKYTDQYYYLCCPVQSPPCDDKYYGSESSVLISTPSWNKERVGIFLISFPPPWSSTNLLLNLLHNWPYLTFPLALTSTQGWGNVTLSVAICMKQPSCGNKNCSSCAVFCELWKWTSSWQCDISHDEHFLISSTKLEKNWHKLINR